MRQANLFRQTRRPGQSSWTNEPGCESPGAHRMTHSRFRPGLRAPMFLIGLAALTSAQSAEPGATVYAPPSAQNTEGNSDNSYPLSGDPIRYQQVFSATIFPGGNQRITQIAFRPDGPNGRAFATTLSNIEIHLSTTPKAPDKLSKTFAENVGGDDTIIQ